MILETLYKYAERNGIVPSEYMMQMAEAVIDLNENGDYQGFECGRFPLAAPTPVKRTGITPKPNFFDNASYSLGLVTKQAKKARTKSPALILKQHEAFRMLLEGVPSKGVAAVLAFLKKGLPAELTRAEWTGGEHIAFRVNGRFIYDDPAFRAHCRSVLDEAEATEVCRITGQPCVPGFFPTFKNLPGSQGSNLISFHVHSSRFENRDSEACYPVLREVREGVAAAWNHLTEAVDDSYRRRSAIVVDRAKGVEKREDPDKAIVAFWTLADVSLDPFLIIAQGPSFDEKIEDKKGAYRAALEKAYEGLGSLEVDGDLYALVLKAFQGRIAVLEWIVVPLRNVVANLRQFRRESGLVTLKLFFRNLPTYQTSIVALRTILEGTPYPRAFISEILRINHKRWPDTNGEAPKSLITSIYLRGNPMAITDEATENSEAAAPLKPFDPSHPPAYWLGCYVALGLFIHARSQNTATSSLESRISRLGSTPKRSIASFDEKVQHAITLLKKRGDSYSAVKPFIDYYTSSFTRLWQKFPRKLSQEDFLTFKRGYYQQTQAIEYHLREAASKKAAAAASN